MLNWHKDKKEDKLPDSDLKVQAKKNSNVTFHTMQDDLNALEGKITLKEKGEEEKEAKASQEDKSVNPFSGVTSEQPDYSSTSHKPSYDKSSAVSEKLNAESVKLPPLSNARKVLSQENKRKLDSEKAAAPKKERSAVLSFLIPVLIILIIVSIALGSYLFWKTRNPELPAAPPTEVPTEEPQPAEIPAEKYSSENPNYLSIDTESDFAEDISQMLIRIAFEIKELKNSGPFEFAVTDANNNPLSFSIFAYLFEINLSSETLNSLEESFSLYFYTDNENVRLGVAANIQDTGAIVSEMTGEESTLVSGLQPLFLNNSFSDTKKMFNTSQYKDFQIRYVNLDEQNTLSVDYSIVENQLVMGFSKNTIRAIIDKIQQTNITVDTENTSTDDGVDIEL